nr:MAG TPA: hypothetical protein [Caudoviricetes sp.]
MAERNMNGMLDVAIWGFLQPGSHHELDIPLLKESVHQLCRMTMQKTAGQKPYAKKDDISFDNLERLKWQIICEAVLLVLSGKLDRLDEGLNNETD